VTRRFTSSVGTPQNAAAVTTDFAITEIVDKKVDDVWGLSAWGRLALLRLSNLNSRSRQL